MTSAAGSKTADHSRTRSVLGAFVVVWLNLALQPCAMALGSAEDHDCPHCPPSHAGEQSDHGMHAGHMAGEEAASGEMPCSTAATDCSLSDELNYDGRAVKLELKDAPGDAPVAIQPAFVSDPALRPGEYLGWHSTRSPPPASSVPLNVFYCVYLK